MHIGCIVIACNSGGPLESIEDKKTGFLIKPDAQLWGKQMLEISQRNLK